MAEEALARRMFLILHDPFSGKPSAPPELTKYALIAAALADLLLHRRIAVDNGRIMATGARGNSMAYPPSPAPPAPAAPPAVAPPRTTTDDVHALLLRNIPPGGADITRCWIDSFTDLVYEMVARGLVADGVVRRVRGRGFLRRGPDRFPALDLLEAAGPRVRFEHMMRSPHEMDLIAATFASILHGLRIQYEVETDRDRAAIRNTSASAAHQLPADVRDLLETITTAVAEVTLTFHRL